MINISASPRSHSLRHSVLAALAIGFLLLTGAQYYVTGTFVERQLLDIESADAFARLRNLHHALEVMKEDIDSTTADWSRWDATYAYTTNVDADFGGANLDPATLARLRLDFVAVVDENGRTLYAHSVNAAGTELLDAPADIVRMSEGAGPLSGKPQPMRKLTGLVASASGIFMVSSQPVLKSLEDAPPRGRLIMGRSMQDFVLPALRRMTGEKLELQPPGSRDSQLGPSYREQGRDALSSSDSQLTGFTPLDDLWGQPVAQLRFQMDRPTQAMLSGARRYLLAAMLVVGLMFCVTGLVIIQQRVVVPLERLAATVDTIGAEGGSPARLPVTPGTSREFHTLREAINGMLQQLEQQQVIRHDRDAAVAANRLKSEFLATMSHEIRTPMNGVLGMCELLQRTELDPRQKHLSDMILRSARSLLEILNDILDFSKIESGRLELENASFSPAEVVHSVSAPFIAAAQGKGLDFSVRIEAGVPQLLIGDALRLRQVLNNLLSNAIKFTDKGAISLSCSLVGLAGDCAELRFVVSDTGIGVAASVQEQIFEPFAQAQSDTSRRYGGTGLGLAIVRRLVTVMGGRIDVHSELGRGSTFTFTAVLRRTADQLLSSRIASAEATGPRFSIAHAPSILLAEDNAVNREVLTEMLEHIGCRVTAVENGALALAAVASRTFDAILMDCQMPVMDGQTAAAELRALERAAAQKPTFIIALTADATAENRKRCLEAGMDAVVTKPISQASLRDLILQAVRPAASLV